jgi:glucose-1-phosphatase
MIRVVLFDLGGVLVRVSGVAAMKALAGIDDDEEVWRRWLACGTTRAFERGLCSEVEFAEGIVADWDLRITPEGFLDEFTRWPDGLYDGAADLVAEVRARVGVGCVSNTNPIHWRQQVSWGVADLFDQRFLSHELGLIKPDRDLFEHVASAVGFDPGEILFLDDNLVNVEQAIEVGFLAEQVRGVLAARATLARHGLAEEARAT